MNAEPKSIQVFRPIRGAGRVVIGTLHRNDVGWGFFPRVSGRNPSKKAHPTWEKAIPRWCGYPHRCSTEIIK